MKRLPCAMMTWKLVWMEKNRLRTTEYSNSNKDKKRAAVFVFVSIDMRVI